MARRLVRLAAHVRPVFMLPVVGMSVCGALLAPSASAGLAAQHAAAVGTALFVAHLRDGLVDGHLRGEETPLLSVSAYRRATAVAVVVTLAFAWSLVATSGVLAAGSVLALLSLALLHAPYLDRHPVPVTVDYPVGIGITLVGGFATQTGVVTVDVVAVGCFTATALVVLGFVTGGVFTRVAAVAAVAALGCAGATAATTPRWAVRVQMALSYAFVGSLFVALCGRDCAGWTLLDRLIPASAVGQIQLYLVGGGPQLVEYLALTALL